MTIHMTGNHFFWDLVLSEKNQNGSNFETAIYQVAKNHLKKINEYDYFGLTPLHHAVHDALIYNDDSGVSALLALGANALLKTKTIENSPDIIHLNVLEFAQLRYEEYLNIVSKNQNPQNREFKIINNILNILTVQVEKDQMDSILITTPHDTIIQKI